MLECFSLGAYDWNLACELGMVFVWLLRGNIIMSIIMKSVYCMVATGNQAQEYSHFYCRFKIACHVMLSQIFRFRAGCILAWFSTQSQKHSTTYYFLGKRLKSVESTMLLLYLHTQRYARTKTKWYRIRKRNISSGIIICDSRQRSA